MDWWRNRSVEQRPKVLDVVNIAVAVLLHAVVFGVFSIIAVLQNVFAPKETVVPIELQIVVNENLDGKIDEPPPLANTPPKKPEIPRPKPPVEKKIDPPKNLDAVVKVKDTGKIVKKDPEKKKKEQEKPKEPEKKELPKKTREELFKERLERMRAAAKPTKRRVDIEVKNRPSGDGRTDRRKFDKDTLEKMLNQGYVPGNSNNVAESEMQRCISLIKMALQRKWDELAPPIDREGVVVLSVQVTEAGRLVNCRLVKGCGGALSDKAVLAVARSVGIVNGLSREFISRSRSSSITINYTVESR